MPAPYPPGPPPHRPWSILRTLWSLRSLAQDPLGFIGGRFARYGDLYHVDEGGGSHLYVVRDPDLVHTVLVTKARSFRKAGGINDRVRPFVGNGLLTSDGDFWKSQRRKIQPGFHAQRIGRYGEIFVNQALALDLQDGQVVDVGQVMMALTLRVVCRTLFDHEASGATDEVAAAMEGLRQGARPGLLPAFVPTKRRRQWRAAQRSLHGIIDGMVAQRRTEGLRGDLLSMLLEIADGEDGMSEQQLRDELVTLFLAGHETTSHALTWTWYLLSQHPKIRERLDAELDQVVGDRAPTLDDVPRLVWTDAVLREAMRLYPPAYVVARVANEPVELGGYALSEGDQVVVWIWHIHHDARWFERPEAYEPERFLAPTFPAQAYLPFGAGTRKCIGAGFAMLELRLILATLARRFHFTLDPTQTVDVSPRVTLAPKHGMRMRVHRIERRAPRDGAAAAP